MLYACSEASAAMSGEDYAHCGKRQIQILDCVHDAAARDHVLGEWCT